MVMEQGPLGMDQEVEDMLDFVEGTPYRVL
jgi:hypothetical protein